MAVTVAVEKERERKTCFCVLFMFTERIFANLANAHSVLCNKLFALGVLALGPPTSGVLNLHATTPCSYACVRETELTNLPRTYCQPLSNRELGIFETYSNY